MSILNAAFYNVMDKATNKDTYDGLAGSLGEQFKYLSDSMKEDNEDLREEIEDVNYVLHDVNDSFDNQISVLERQLGELSEISKGDERYHRSVIDYTRESLDHTYDTEISDINDSAFDNLVERMRMSVFRVEMINAEYDIVEPMMLAMRELSLDEREDSLAYHHENTMWFARMVQVMESLKKDETDAGRGVVLATRQFLRHPVWYTLTGAAQAMISVGKFLGGMTLGTLFGFGKKETIHEKILTETKKQTEFMITGQVDQSKSLWQQFTSGGVAGLIGRDIATNLNLQEIAQQREDARASGGEMQGGVRGWLADFFFKNEVTRRKWDHTEEEEQREERDITPSFIEGQFRVVHEDLMALSHQNDELADFFNEMNNIFNEQHEEVMVAYDANGKVFEQVHRSISGGFDRTERVINEGVREQVKTNTNITQANREIVAAVNDANEDQEDRGSIMTRWLRRIYGEGKKTNRHLLMAKLMTAISGIGSFLTNFKSGAGFKLLGATMAGFAFKNILDGIKEQEASLGGTIRNLIGATFAGFMMAGPKGALAAAAGTSVLEIYKWGEHNYRERQESYEPARQKREEERQERRSIIQRRDEILAPYRERSKELTEIISSRETTPEERQKAIAELVEVQKAINDPETVEKAIEEQRKQQERESRTLNQNIRNGFTETVGAIRSTSSGLVSQGRNMISGNGATVETKNQMIAALEEQGITDPVAQANILAQIQHESGFRPRSEELENYSADTLFRFWGKGNERGNNVRFQTREEAQALVDQGPEAVGNYVYGGRLGNARDEGFKYRGRGLIQLTGKDNYRKYGEKLGIDLVNNPDLANDPEIAKRIAAVYFAEHQQRGKDLTDINVVGKAVGYAGGDSETARRAQTAQTILGQMRERPVESISPTVSTVDTVSESMVYNTPQGINTNDVKLPQQTVQQKSSVSNDMTTVEALLKRIADSIEGGSGNVFAGVPDINTTSLVYGV